MIRKVGVSIYSPAELDQILEVFVPDLIQFPFNVYDQRMMRFHGLNELRSRGGISTFGVFAGAGSRERL